MAALPGIDALCLVVGAVLEPGTAVMFFSISGDADESVVTFW